MTTRSLVDGDVAAGETGLSCDLRPCASMLGVGVSLPMCDRPSVTDMRLLLAASAVWLLAVSCRADAAADR